ncbi:TIGR03936 family radical SAM-associated protein [Desulfosporosinus nitroreducens]|uniref:TIGR03936 family radical SAM-associated protein n=1 Tax=Desulfosporosinus nitroreducens TaxID=2018668 RepID=A0ABT8QU62_9FIRM|nr:TIGR03936 family radical SAM-associated protein [Desulfosporosinus nitroreducens]MCO1600987.1 TIGR03936 family radical SAM-associated protein [Desulfosporosinus nitroreducens]MCO5385793.1 TIGR03936 family radical SAM-associated protein [Desulfosporosinus sp.]MDO0824903.1 TIGR03936 family radical SAM-associated protein [Desulfosporosinus nitroreducens]
MSAMRLRIAYTKIEDARYIAHLDLTRVFERAIRRAGIHMSYSEGFNPRPKISFGFALAVGTEGEREYVDVELQEEIDLGEVLARVQEQLPPGIRLLQGRALDQGAKSLMAVLNAASYRIRVPMALPIQAERLQEAVSGWLGREHVTYSRYSKKGPTDKDIRPWIKLLEAKIQGDEVIFDLEVEMGNSGSVRPEEVLASLRELENLPIELDGIQVIRTGVHVSYEGGKSSPIELA